MTEVNHDKGYAGDITAEQAWQWAEQGEAILVDVRTDAERAWVGYVPGGIAIALKQWPGMVPNPNFESDLQALPNDKKLVMLCRSGVRSIVAAKRATELGFEAYNILEGFEGDLDAHAHRGQSSGWRKSGLPWAQQ